jgi:uncharacterized membrane protein
MARASQAKDEIARLAWDETYLILSDVAVVVRHPDGTFTLDREAFPARDNVVGSILVGLGIRDDFVRDVERMMKPGTSALFVLDDVGALDVILHRIRGLGGTVLKTNVDMERARLVQATLAASAQDPPRCR